MTKQKRKESAKRLTACFKWTFYLVICYATLIGCTAAVMRVTGTPRPLASETPTESVTQAPSKTPAYIYILPTAAFIVTDAATLDAVIVNLPSPTATDQPNACNVAVSGFDHVVGTCLHDDPWIQTWNFNWGWCLWNQRVVEDRHDLRGIDAYCRGDSISTPAKKKKSKKSSAQQDDGDDWDQTWSTPRGCVQRISDR